MRRVVLGIVSVVALAAISSCSSPGPDLSNRFGDCNFEPKTQCPNQDFAAVSIPSADLRGANFSGSSFRRADLRGAILRNANLTGTNFSAADLTGADLRGANLSQAVLNQATMDHAQWAGSVRTGTKYCQTLLPDGSVSECEDLEIGGPVATPDPPEVATFAAHEPVTCFNDSAGDGIEVDWRIRNASSAGFLIDGIQASTALGTGGIKRIPFPCDDEEHTVTIQAFGVVPPLASSSFTLSLPPGRPSAPIR